MAHAHVILDLRQGRMQMWLNETTYDVDIIPKNPKGVKMLQLSRSRSGALLLPCSHFNITNFSLSGPTSPGNHLLQDLFGGYKLNSRALVQNLPLLNGLYVGILSAMGVHVVLYFLPDVETLSSKRER